MIGFKDLKVGVKLGLGFGALLALAAALGVLAVVNMKAVQVGGEKLAQAYVPEVRVASAVEVDSLRVMFAMRGYFFNKDKKYWDQGLKHLADVRKDLTEAKDLYTAQAFLTGLKENAAKALAGVDEYEAEAKVSNEAVEQFIRERQTMDGLAAEFIKNVDAFLQDQHETMTQELAAGAAGAKIEERHEKLTMVMRIATLGSDCRIKNFKSQATGDVEIARSALPNFDQISQICDQLKAVTRKEDNLRQIAAIRASAEGYGQSLKRIVDLGLKLKDLDVIRNKAAEGVLAAAGATSKDGMEQTQKIAAAAAEDLAMASKVVIGGLVVAVVLGFGVAIVLTRLITGPLRKGVFFATKVAEGDLNQKLDVVQKDEVGVLAEAMRKMVAELKQKLGFAQGVLDGFVLPCSVFDTDNKATFINSHMMQALDKDGDPKIHYGENSGQFIYGDPGRETLTLKALREKRRLDLEVEYTTGRGVSKIFQATSTPINDLDGNLLGVLATWFELTEIRTQQKKIEAQNQKIAEAAAAANTVSDQVASASEELSAQIEQSSRGSEEQRNRTGEAATAMEEMNATVMEVAKSASTAAELADKAKAKATEGEHLVDEVVNTVTRINEQAEVLKKDMTELGHQAEGIGQIMNVIADIADQTNLLALNAAIEAARAGDAGRGFAVVADEVRKLAEKTMNATNEVGAYIKAVQESAHKNIQGTEATTKAIAASTEMAGKSGAALREIVDMVEKTADQVRGIATASEQQSAASEEISRTTEDINRIAGETAEAMTQSAQAVSDLARLAQELKTIINDMQQS